jgi:two-component system, NtrC family, sensor kinase
MCPLLLNEPGAGGLNMENELKATIVERVEEMHAPARTYEDLRKSEAQYRALFENNPHPMWVYDERTLRFLTVNEAAVRRYGYSREEFLSLTIKHIRNAEDVPALLKAIGEDGPGLANAGVWKHRKKDGSIIDVEVTSYGLIFDGKRAQLVLAFDVTDKQRVQQALREKIDELAATTQQMWQASKLATVGELAASIAHELNNPLATVSLRVESLMQQLTHDKEKHRSLEIIVSEVERMASLVTNLLQFTRRNYRQVSTVDIADEIVKSIDLISYYLRNRRIQVLTEFHNPLPAIHADRQQLRQVFLNLMTNASDAMPEGGQLTVRVHVNQPEERVIAEFADSGEGIAENQLRKIWQPFYTSKPEGKGTGLGLPICSRIIEEHGGEISLQSKLGRGTTVRLALPIANSRSGVTI